MQIGVLPNFVICDYLDVVFPRSWLRDNGPGCWPARTPDLNHFDFFLWGDMKGVMFLRKIYSLNDLQEPVLAAAK